MHRLQAFRDLDGLDFLKLLDSALNEGRLGGVVAKAVDERLESFDVRLLLLVALSQELEIPLPLHLVLRKVSGVEVEAAHEQFRHVIRGAVEKIPVMRYYEVTAAVALKEQEEPLTGFDIEVIRRLVEKEQIGLLKEYPRKGGAHSATRG